MGQQYQPDVWVRSADLGGEAPVALVDSLSRFELAIDFSYPPEQISAALTSLFQDSVQSGRWGRNDTREHGAAAPEQDEGAAPHPHGDDAHG